MKNELLSAVLLTLALASGSALARGEEPTDRDAFAEILARAERVEPKARESLAFEIVSLGGDVVARSFEALIADARTTGRVDGARADVLLSVLEQVGPFHWRSLVEPAMQKSPDRAVLRVVCAVVGRSGLAHDVPLLVSAVRRDADSALYDDVERATQDLLNRDESGFDAIGSALPIDDPAACEPFVAGVERTCRPRAALSLARWVERHESLRRTCLQHLSRLGLALPKPVGEEVVLPLRALLERGDAATLAPLLVCLGRLEDEASIPQFLRWLKEGEHAVRQNALWALQSTTHLKLKEDPKVWSTWWATESKWWDESSTTTFSMLRRGTKAEKVAAMNAIDMRRTGRHRLAAELAPALEDRDLDIACMAARGLANLGSSSALDGLLTAMESPEPRLATAAHAAVEAIAKRTLSTDAGTCRRELGLD